MPGTTDREGFLNKEVVLTGGTGATLDTVGVVLYVLVELLELTSEESDSVCIIPALETSNSETTGFLVFSLAVTLVKSVSTSGTAGPVGITHIPSFLKRHILLCWTFSFLDSSELFLTDFTSCNLGNGGGLGILDGS